MSRACGQDGLNGSLPTDQARPVFGCPPWCAMDESDGVRLLHSAHKPGTAKLGELLLFPERVDLLGPAGEIAEPGDEVLVIARCTASAPGTTGYRGLRLTTNDAHELLGRLLGVEPDEQLSL